MLRVVHGGQSQQGRWEGEKPRGLPTCSPKNRGNTTEAQVKRRIPDNDTLDHQAKLAWKSPHRTIVTRLTGFDRGIRTTTKSTASTTLSPLPPLPTQRDPYGFTLRARRGTDHLSTSYTIGYKNHSQSLEDDATHKRNVNHLLYLRRTLRLNKKNTINLGIRPRSFALKPAVFRNNMSVSQSTLPPEVSCLPQAPRRPSRVSYGRPHRRVIRVERSQWRLA